MSADTGTGADGAIDMSGNEPVVEDNGRWFIVFLTVFTFLFVSAFAFLVHSLALTFG